ncbi:MAG: citrate synthase [Acidobacteria bacterium]|nr:MAG: citrate synthase [Acidobacteriota bacterium]
MSNSKLDLNGQEYELPVIVGTEGETAVDVLKLRAKSGAITFDPGYGNTGSCASAITFIDGEKGILRYRGYPIEQVATAASFAEVCYLLVYGELPNRAEYEEFRDLLARHTLLHEDMKKFFEGYSTMAHPMAILSSMVGAVSTYYPSAESDEDLNLNIIRLLAKTSTIAAFSYKKSIGQPFVYPRNDLSYTENFLHMMFAVPAETYEVPPVLDRALNLLLILHADHEQNCSTSTVRMVGSSEASLFASISAGISALSGPLHGGANQKVIEMLEKIRQDGGDYQKYMDMAKDKSSGFRLMGFGHRVYKNFDPRATLLKEAADEVLEQLGVADPLLDIARNLEDTALKDDYFVERKLYPNVDFYSGIIYRAMSIPTEMFTVLFALGRLPGWIAHWKEMRSDPDGRIHRPRQVYVGETERDFVPFDKR